MFVRRRKRLGTMLAVVLVLATVLTSAPVEIQAAPPFAGGSGTEADPYQIQNAEQLNAVRAVSEAVYHFKLIDNIDLTSYLAKNGPGHHGGAGWEPIGSVESQFHGTFDGDGHTIYGLMIDGSNTTNIGLFGYTASDSIIKNVGLVDMNISGQYNVGGLAGFNRGSIENTYATGNVAGSGNVGGLVGLNIDEGSIVNSYATGGVTGNQTVGGLLGYNLGSLATIINSFAKVEVTGNDTVGGLVGRNEGNIESSFAEGKATGNQTVGGLVGDNAGVIRNTYATGNVAGEYFIGGLVGFPSSGNIDHSYYDLETTNQEDIGKGEGKTTAEMKDRNNYVSWDFALTWGIDTVHNEGYPYLKDIQVFVAYEGNENTGGTAPKAVSYMLGSFAAIANKGDLVKKNYTFTGWNTQADGKGTNYAVNDPIMLTNHVTLYAQWLINSLIAPEIQSVAGNGYATISWSSVAGATKYHVYQSTTSGSYGSSIATVSSDVHQYNVTGLTNVTTYYFVVIAENSGGLSDTSNEVSALPAAKLGEEVTAEEGAPVFIEGGTVITGLPSGIRVTATEASSTDYMASGTIQLAGTPLQFKILGLTEGQKARGIELKIPTGDPNAGLSYFNSIRGKWELLGSSRYEDGFVIATVNHFSIYAPIAKSAQLIADSITSIQAPAKDETTLTLPNVLEGFNVSIKESSNPSVVQKDGTVIPPTNATTVNVVLEVTKIADDSKAVTESMSIVVPAKTTTPNGGSSDNDGDNESDVTPDVTTSNERSVLKGQSATFTLNGVAFSIPIEAMNQTTKIKVVQVTNTSNLSVSSNMILVGDVFEITKDISDNFTQAITIILPLDTSKFDTETHELAIYWFDEKTDEWVILNNIKVDMSNGTVSGEVDHFTKFAVLAVEKEEVIEEEEKIEFTDIAGHWAEINIVTLVNRGAITGYADGTFKPDHHITRAEFTSILAHTLVLEMNGNKLFVDTTNHWAKDVIATAYAHGIIHGYSDTTFGPDELITREQMASIIVKAFELQRQTSRVDYVDKSQISAWAVADVETAVSYGIIGGYNDGTIKPSAHATRAEAVLVIVRALTK